MFAIRLLVSTALMYAVCAIGAGVRAGEIQTPEQAQERLATYRGELQRFRQEFGGSRELPDERFFLFGMGLRRKCLYKEGRLLDAITGEEILRFDVSEDFILPADYTVFVKTKSGETASIIEDEKGVWIERSGTRSLLPGSDAAVTLPKFESSRFPSVLRVLHQELLVNVTKAGPVPNFFVYPKPWYRDGAMMSLCFKATQNLDSISAWILGLEEPYDRNNAGEAEPDNLGQALFLVSLVSDASHPLVKKVLEQAAKREVTRDGVKFIEGHSDFSLHPAYQTKWIKYGLRALGLPDPYSIPKVAEGYSALFWMDYRESYVPGPDSNDRGDYPYLGWACDHFHGTPKSPISNRDYPLTWEANASQADYSKIAIVSQKYARGRVAAPHTWHAAEVFLYTRELDEQRRGEAAPEK